jgi:hypothetical protein
MPIDWSSLNHAYGPASDIPQLLLQLRTAPAPSSSYKDEPWFSLWRALCHQGDVYTASFAALPELVRIAADREPDAAVGCLYLAAIIELARHNVTAPAVPAQLQEAYRRGVSEAQALVLRVPTAGLSKERRQMLRIIAAVVNGQLAEARRLVDAD